MRFYSEKSSAVNDKKLLKAVWKTSEEEAGAHGEDIHLGWMLAFIGVLLLLIVFAVAWFAIKRSEIDMTNLLQEKGASLMMSFESALRTGMRGASGLQVQTLFEEMAKSPDIEFIAVTMPDGIILAHSDRSRIGEIMTVEKIPLSEKRVEELKPENLEKALSTYAEGAPVLLVYRTFTMGQKIWPENVPKPVIFLGLDVAPYEIVRAQNRNYVIILTVITLLLGLTGLLVFNYAQKATRSRRSQTRAENEVLRLEEEVRRNEKMAAIGTLAAGVAHEIRNPLSSIKGYATYFFQSLPEGSEGREAAAVMVREVDRLNRVITDLLGLSNQAKLKIKKVNMEQVCKHVLRLLRENAKSRNITLNLSIAPKVPEVEVDMEKLAQALLNLCLNALDAMQPGGKLDLLVAGGKNKICLIVRDNGSGIPEDVLSRIFDPYFTTKGSGTGLGLPMVHKIIKGHHGHIAVRSKVRDDVNQESGTIFYIWLPLNAKSG